MKKKALPTIWEVPDELWLRMEPLILEMDPPKETGRRYTSAVESEYTHYSC